MKDLEQPRIMYSNVLTFNPGNTSPSAGAVLSNRVLATSVGPGTLQLVTKSDFHKKIIILGPPHSIHSMKTQHTEVEVWIQTTVEE
jgi:hypothetical protein